MKERRDAVPADRKERRDAVPADRVPMREQLERLVDEMVTKGLRYEEAHREFEKRFIAQALARAEGNLGKAADLLGIHRNTLSRKMAAYRLRRAS
jgi:DNA-binding NtrC family response regulator